MADLWRLIPAGAGQMARSAAGAATSQAHPRRCGADVSIWMVLPRGTGSSPQVRGRSIGGHLPSYRNRLIPAGAGQMENRVAGSRLAEAHPRRCGADETRQKPYPSPRGSSPQVRGRSLARTHRAPGAGLIPAGAGQIW
ncbi:hypothetical protein HMPREF0294_0568 [Corynebacterium glucuronolyticum ATCC 51867]|nr:hypothetical protein HMPREF0294_0568 [Corynebacterium glucuronolyticum ATCC 51867]